MEQLVNFVIRPPRAEYIPTSDLLEREFPLKGKRFKRRDLKITNSQGYILECSHYLPDSIPEGTALPCVIYCHGNSGCRADANEAAIILLPCNITVFALDFSGSGLSEGEYVTLGWNEMEDLKAVVTHLREDKGVSCIGLWGRSMGAVTSIMYAAQDPSIGGIVVDSPFSNLVDLMMELVDVYKVRLPKFTLKVAIQYMRKVIQKKAQFDIMKLDTIEFAKTSYVPALFGHANEDSFIKAHHSDLLFKAYAGDKNIIKFPGDHNSPRPRFYYDSITIFFYNVLQPPETPVAELAHSGTDYDDDELDLHSGIDENVLYEIMHGIQPTQQVPNDSISSCSFHDEGLGESSTEEAINQSRARWQMSRTEMPADFGKPQSDAARSTRRDSTEHSVDRTRDASDITSHTLGSISDDEVWDDYFTCELSSQATTSVTHFPYTVDDEERMLMEAIELSLQDTKSTNSFPLDNEHEQVSQRELSMDQEASTSHNYESLLPDISTQIGSVREPDGVIMNQEASSNQETSTSRTHESLLPDISTQTGPVREPDRVQLPDRSQSTEAPTLGMLEALGQRWGIGLFRAIGSRRGS